MSNVELIETIDENDGRYILNPKIDGFYQEKLKDYLNKSEGEEVSNSIFKNAYKTLKYFINTEFCSENNLLSKILAVGRVQSGKTAFFLSSASLAFDNGYDIVYLVGGTKDTLKFQNLDRAKKYFTNNSSIKVYDINEVDYDELSLKLNLGYKIILVTLKNAAENKNLGKAKYFTNLFSGIPSLVIDDEGDEYTPGAPKLKNRNNRIGANHDLLVECLNSLKICTFLSVTATPQANFLISTIDEISPDFCVLVEPGYGYIGGNQFHDSKDNQHVVPCIDTDIFKQSVPESFKDCLFFFIFAAALKRAQGDLSPYTMLVHPSSFTKIHRDIVEKINNYLLLVVSTLRNKNDVSYSELLEKITVQLDTYKNMNNGIECNVSKSQIEDEIVDVLDELVTYEFNIKTDDVAKAKNESYLYKIFVGGNMLGRGLTIKNLCVSYIYRDAKQQAIDTLYQRARWLGYKAKYFDICRVYMTDELQNKFIATVENENDMWDSLNKFLLTKENIKKFPRVFQLNYETGKLILTRKSVANTVVIERVNAGFSYDKSIMFKNEAKSANRMLYENFFNTHYDDSYDQVFSTNDYQTHRIIKMSFMDFYNQFLVNYNYPRGSNFGLKSFQKIIEQIDNGELEEDISVIIMRYKTHEYRSPSYLGADSIKELPQSYNVATNYPGDKNLTGYTDKMYFQIHLVYVDDNKKEDYMPLLCFNNPLSQKTICYVTGDNYYDSI